MNIGDAVRSATLSADGQLQRGEIIAVGRLHDWTVRWDNGNLADEYEDDLEVVEEEEP